MNFENQYKENGSSAKQPAEKSAGCFLLYKIFLIYIVRYMILWYTFKYRIYNYTSDNVKKENAYDKKTDIKTKRFT